MVRLKECIHKVRLKHVHKFQFQNGTIKSYADDILAFQDYRFNSKMVRLKGSNES